MEVQLGLSGSLLTTHDNYITKFIEAFGYHQTTIQENISVSKATFQHGNQECIETVFVVNGLKTNLLGLSAIRKLHLIASLNSVDEYRSGVYEHFPTLFHGLGNFGDEYQIKLQPDAKPFALYTARHVPIQLCEQVKIELERMESIGVISPVTEPTDWCDGMVVVPRKNSTVLAHYCLTAETKVSASSHGLEAVLLQQERNMWRPVCFASRSMTKTENRYAQIEKEALAITWACDKFHNYLIVRRFLIETDHKPLVPLLTTKYQATRQSPTKSIRVPTAVDYTVEHIPGKLLYVADALSKEHLRHIVIYTRHNL